MKLLEPLLVFAAVFASSVAGNDCDKGWIGYGDECFKVVMTPVSWSVAQKSCEAEGAILARLDTLAKNVFMTGYLHMFKTMTSSPPFVWIGGHRVDGRWMWTGERGDYSEMTGYTNWSVNEPGPTEGCVEIRSFDLRWNDIPCSSQPNYFVCQKV